MASVLSKAFPVFLLLLCFWIFIPNRQAHLPTVQTPRTLAFLLGKDYAAQTYNGVNIVVNDRTRNGDDHVIALRARPTTVYKPRSIDRFMGARRNPEAEPVEWVERTIEGPDVEDRHTLQQLAMMSGNAYALPGQKNWYDLDEVWNQVRPKLYCTQNLMAHDITSVTSIWLGG